jgi:hypothetical protein
MKLGWQPGKWLEKKRKRVSAGFNSALLPFMAPTTGVPARRLSAFSWRLIQSQLSYAGGFQRTAMAAEIAECLRSHQVRSVGMSKRILGCPHEEGIDYPEGQACPQCPFWSTRDRWAGT